MRRKHPKPISEMSKQERLAEARGRLSRAEAEYQGDNRYGYYGDNLCMAIARDRKLITDLEAEIAASANG